MATSTIKLKKICEFCKKEFYYQKISTKFCSRQCATKAHKIAKRLSIAMESQELSHIQSNDDFIWPNFEKELLTPKECAELMGIALSTVYKLIYGGTLRANQLSSRMTRVLKKDVLAAMDGRYEKRIKQKLAPITDFYTSKEVLSKFGISNSGLYKIAKEQNFPKTYRRGKTLWSKKHIDAYFAKQASNPDIDEWYSVEDIRAKYKMTAGAIYTLVSEMGIPKKKDKNKVYYSKLHFDRAKGISVDDIQEYYTVAEAMKKFHLSRDQLYHYVKYYDVPRIMKGKFSYISKKRLDILFAEPKI
jgi:excisionase family DNA binding protein